LNGDGNFVTRLF